MTPTETKVLAPYERLDPLKLWGKSITHTYYDEYTFIAVTSSDEYVKICTVEHADDCRLDTNPLEAINLKNMGLIDKETWEQILNERKQEQMVRRRSSTEVTIRRLVKEHGADKIRDLIGDQE